MRDPDAQARLAEFDPERASAQLHEELCPVRVREGYWVDELAEELRSGSNLSLHEWAEIRGLSPSTLSSVFQREFGVSPKRFRLESRTRVAWRAIMRSSASLTDIAFNAGFSDLPHLSRSIRMFTGRSPGEWRTLRS